MALARSPLAPETFPDLPPIAGVRVAGQAVGLKKTGARDLFLAVVDPGATVAVLFTRSLFPSPPVEWCRQALHRASASSLVAISATPISLPHIARLTARTSVIYQL